MRKTGYLILAIGLLWIACRSKKTGNVDVSKLGANEEVSAHLQSFKGRGALTDTSALVPATEAVKRFRTASDIRIDLVLSEPKVRQPVEMKFDRQGRLWVVQYNQYPYPKGLKVVGVDSHLRLKFDKVPLPPPSDVKGADKITFFEDTDGDGRFDKSTDAITGLNITTSVLFGKKRIWVLSPPYLLAYWDRDGNGIPEGEPEVHLRGFGLEDTHAIANSLRWGPDGWIYGAQGSTATAKVSSKVSKDIYFSGQAIWRYHPLTNVFEVFAEGGGNTFNVEIDAKGRIFSGHNGYTRGPYFKQGGYYSKSWGKHGPLTNPYAFGYLEDMELEGERTRFTHSLIRYEGGALPQRYEGNLIALNALQGNLMLTAVEKNGSTLKVKDIEKIVDTDDRWFRPIDIKTGPDGNVYFTDWYDSRLSHVDARDTWHKNSGRVYRLSNANGPANRQILKIASLGTESLLKVLYDKNKENRFMALHELGDRADLKVVAPLLSNLKSDTSRIGLESLWAIHLLGKFSEEVAVLALRHRDPFVREWGVRLIGDKKSATKVESQELIDLSRKEKDIAVRSQLAASARRLPGASGLEMVRNLVNYHQDEADPDLPLMLWWAMESKADSDRERLLKLLDDERFTARAVTRDVLMERLVQRFAMGGGEENYSACQIILKKSLDKDYSLKVLTGVEEGLRGVPNEELPDGLKTLLNQYRLKRGEPVLAAGLREKDPATIAKALKLIGDEKSAIAERLIYVRMLGEGDFPTSVPVLLRLLSMPGSTGGLKGAALASLERYDAENIGTHVVKVYPDYLRAETDVRLGALSLLTSRGPWAQKLVAAVQGIKTIKPEDVPLNMVSRMKSLNDGQFEKTVLTIWPQARSTSGTEKNQKMVQVQKILKSGSADTGRGKVLFTNVCGACHNLFGEGGEIGPELTGYDRRDMDYFVLNTVDPNADIREGYATYTLKAKTGQTVVGRLVERTKQTVKIKPMAGLEQTYSTHEIASLEPLPASLMPERLLDGLQDQEVRDLFHYIKNGLPEK